MASGDVRLVPTALVSWIVTAWDRVADGNVCALCCVVVALAAAHCGGVWRAGRGTPATGFDQRRPGRGRRRWARALGLRSRCAPRRSIATQSPWHLAPMLVTVTPQRAQCRSGAGWMFRATVQRLRMTRPGRVVVFRASADFGELMVGQPVQFRAYQSPGASRPDGRGTTRPVGRPWPPARYTAPPTIVRHRFAPRFVRCCPLTRPRCYRPWFSAIPRRSP